MPGRAFIATSLAGLALGATASGAGAVTFGADLNQAVNVTRTCPNGFPFLFDQATGFTTCTWTAGDASTPSQGLFAPQSGTVTRIRVRMGAVGGRVQFAVLRWLVQGASNNPVPNKICCTLQSVSPVFTAVADQVNTFDVNLPMAEEGLPQPLDPSVKANDQLGITLLDAGTVVPLIDTGDHSGTSLIFNNSFFPAFTTPTLAPRYSDSAQYVSGFLVAMNADLTPPAGVAPAPAPAPLPVPTPTPLPVPAFTIPTASALVRNGIAPITVVCGGNAACVGQVVLGSTRGAVAAEVRHGHATRKVVYGTTRFTVAAGRRGTARVRLNAAGRSLLRARRSVRVWSRVTVTGVAQPTIRRITLRR